MNKIFLQRVQSYLSTLYKKPTIKSTLIVDQSPSQFEVSEVAERSACENRVSKNAFILAPKYTYLPKG